MSQPTGFYILEIPSHTVPKGAEKVGNASHQAAFHKLEKSTVQGKHFL